MPHTEHLKAIKLSETLRPSTALATAIHSIP